ncbi:MAG: hypothetical protein COB67_00635 [SAR324 cluster bacterium]|uniref:Uncharacterized protein n=1 Tax=SAR324 cluster bacterium TaxID=2024889 RepID=A0A2A4TBU1_9DELT|nr:MAG: hypothetical protein COB67_00635 [SAR324 cluster bacterium]
MSDKISENHYGDNDYVYCQATTINFQALENAGYEYCVGHKKLHEDEDNYFIEIDKKNELRVVISNMECLDFTTIKIIFSEAKNKWEKSA